MNEKNALMAFVEEGKEKYYWASCIRNENKKNTRWRYIDKKNYFWRFYQGEFW